MKNLLCAFSALLFLTGCASSGKPQDMAGDSKPQTEQPSSDTVSYPEISADPTAYKFLTETPDHRVSYAILPMGDLAYTSSDGAISVQCSYTVADGALTFTAAYTNNTDYDLSADFRRGEPMLDMNGGRSEPTIIQLDAQYEDFPAGDTIVKEYEMSFAEWAESGSNSWNSDGENTVTVDYSINPIIYYLKDGENNSYRYTVAKKDLEEITLTLDSQGNII